MLRQHEVHEPKHESPHESPLESLHTHTHTGTAANHHLTTESVPPAKMDGNKHAGVLHLLGSSSNWVTGEVQLQGALCVQEGAVQCSGGQVADAGLMLFLASGEGDVRWVDEGRRRMGVQR